MKYYLLVAILLLLPLSSIGQTLLLQESFEGTNNYTANTFDDGVDDYFTVDVPTKASLNHSFSGIDGSNCLLAEDIDATSTGDNPLAIPNNQAYIIFNTLDVSSYDTVQITLLLGGTDGEFPGDPQYSRNQFELPDSLLIQYAWNGNIATAGAENVYTGTYTNLAAFRGYNDAVSIWSIPLTLDEDASGTIDPATELDTLSGTLKEYTFKTVVTGTNFSLRIKIDNDGLDDIAVDNIRIYGIVAAANTAPTITINDGSPLAYTENDAATLIDATATTSDADGDADWTGGSLKVQITANAEAADEISINDTDGISPAITISGTNILANGTDIGDLSASGGIVTNNTLLTITFDSDATNENVQEVLQSIRYRNTSDNPGTSNRTVTFTVTDANAGTANDARTIAVSAENDAPTVGAPMPDTTVTEDYSPINYRDLNAVFTDAENGSVLTFSAVSLQGKVTPFVNVPDSVLILTAVTNANGLDTVVVTASDGSLEVKDSLIITIAADNDAPTVAAPMADTTVTEDFATPINYRDLNSVFTDIESGDALNFSAVSLQGKITPSVNGADSVLVLTAVSNAYYIDTVVVTASDGSLEVKDSIIVTINNVNDIPTIVAIADTTLTEDFSPINYRDLNEVFTDVESGTAMHLTAVSLQSKVTLSITPPDSILILTAVNNATGVDTVVVSAFDGTIVVKDSFVITINEANDAPTVAAAMADTTVTEDFSPINYRDLNAVFTDIENGDVLNFSAVSLQGKITPSVNGADSVLVLTAVSNADGLDTVVVTASDGSLEVKDSIIITITGENDAPTVAVAMADTTVTEDFSPINYRDLNAVFTDVESGSALTFSVTSFQGKVTPSVNGADSVLILTAVSNANGLDTVVVTANDGTLEVKDSLIITIAADNDAPTVAAAMSDTTVTEDFSPINYRDLNAVFTDVESGDVLNFSAVSLQGKVTPSVNVTDSVLVLTAVSNADGLDTVVVTASDGSLEVKDSIIITITGENDAPTVATAMADTTVTEDFSPINYRDLNAVFTDAESGSALTFSVASLQGKVTPSVNAPDSVLILTAVSNINGLDTVVVTASDGTLEVKDSVIITIAADNDAPTFTSSAVTNATQDVAYSYLITTNDPDNDALTVASKNTLPSWLSLENIPVPESTFTFAEYFTDINETQIEDIGFDENGNTYLLGRQRLFKVDNNDVITEIWTSSGAEAYGMTVDSDGTIYMIVGQEILKRVTDGTVTSLAGDQFTQGYVDGIGSVARFKNASGLAIDSDGNIIIADGANHRIRKLNTTTLEVTTIAGDGTAATVDGAALSAQLNWPWDVEVASNGDIIICEYSGCRIRKLSNGIVTTIAGSGSSSPSDNADALLAGIYYPTSIDLTSTGEVWMKGSLKSVSRLTTDGALETVIGLAGGSANSEGAVDDMAFSNLSVVAIAPSGRVWTVDGNGVHRSSGTGYALAGIPTNSDVGTHDIVLTLDDGTISPLVEQTFTITVTNVNDAPTASDTTITIDEDSTFTFKADDFRYSDIDVGDALGNIKISFVTDGVAGALILDTNNNSVVDNSELVSAGDIIAAADLPKLKYLTNSGVSVDSLAIFRYSVSDGTTYSTSDYQISVNITRTSAPDGWAQAEKILLSDYTDYDEFGSSVSISGDRAIVGAVGDDNGNGSAYIFQLVNGAWTQLAKLTASDAANNDRFGYSVSISGDRAIVGAYGDESYTGSVYLFEWNGTSWVETKLTASDAGGGDRFGVTVSLSGDRAIVGSSEDDDNGNQSGSAYLFEWDGTSWVETKITASDATGYASFGSSVSISGDRAIIGAYTSAYIYEWNGTNWVETKIIASDGAIGSFGQSVSISGDRAIVGAYMADSYTGKAYLFEWNGTSWIETKLTASDGVANDNFGKSVSISGDRAIVGAYSNVSAYIYNWNGASWVESQLVPKDVNSANFGQSVSISGDHSLIGAVGTYNYSGSCYFFRTNIAPTASDTTITINEDATCTFASNDFRFADVDAGDILDSIQITTLETVGALKLNGVDVVLNQIIGTADITNLTFTPIANGNGTGYDSFGFKVSDGSAWSSSAYTVTFNVTAVNDAPTFTSTPVTNATEDIAYSYKISTEDLDGNALSITAPTSPDWLSINPLNAWSTVGSVGFSVDIVKEPSIAFAPDGTPYVAYEDWGNSYKATVMKFDGNSWIPVGGAGFSANGIYNPSFAIDNNGTPYISFVDKSSYRVTVMKFDGSSWITVGSAGFSEKFASFTSLAVDANGTPYVAYGDGGSSNMTTVMKFDGSSWVTVGTAGFSGGGATRDHSLAISNSGTPYVAYSDAGIDNKTVVMKFDGSSWITVGSAGLSEGGAEEQSLAIDNNGTPYVAYEDAANGGKVTVMKFDGSSWAPVGSVGISEGLAEFPSLAIDDNGTPYVAYRDAPNSYKAIVMKFDGSSWVTVGNAYFSEGNAQTISLAINGTGTPYVVYRDNPNSAKATVMKLDNGSVLSGTPTNDHVGDHPVTLRADDGNGGTVDQSFTITVTNVNDAPIAADTTIVMDEDATFTFKASDFRYSDIDAGDALDSIQITSLETKGALKLSGVDVTLNQYVKTADIANLTFTPATDSNGIGYDSFGFMVNDGEANSAVANTVTFNVTPVIDAPNITTWPTAAVITYGQTLADAMLSGAVHTTAGTFSFTNPATKPDVGTVTYEVTFTPSDAVNYTTATQMVSVTTNKKVLTITGTTAEDKVYDGTTAATVSGGILTGVLTGETVTVTLGSATFADKNVGIDKAVTVTGSVLSGADAGNYALTEVSGLTANITAKAVTITGATATDKVYDGTTAATVSGETLVGVLTGETVTLTLGTATFADKNVGVAKAVTISGSVIGGADAGNYSLTEVSGLTADITAKGLTITGATATDKVYDGTTTATVSGETLSGVLTGETVTLTLGSATFADKNVGIGKAVTVTGSVLSGADAGNYALTEVIGLTANITAKAVTITGTTAEDKVYDGTTAATLSGGTLTGVLTGETVTVTLGLATFADKNVGIGKAVTVTGSVLSGADAGNYALTEVIGLTANITAKAVTISGATAADKVYDGTTAATVSGGILNGAVTGDAVTLTLGTATFADKNVGADKVITVTGSVLSGEDAGNYSLTEASGLTADITAKALAITVNNVSKDAKEVDPEFTVSYEGFITGESEAVLIGTLSLTREPGDTAGTYAITAAGLSAANYAVTYISGTLTITGSLNEAPVLVSALDFVTVTDKPITLSMNQVIATDSDGDQLTLVIGAGANYSVNGLTVIPAAGFVGTLSVPLSVSDGTDTSNVVTVTGTVRSIGSNSVPEIDSIHITPIEKNSSLKVTNAMVVSYDADGDDLTIILSGGENYTVSGQTITPLANYTGLILVPVAVTDGADTSAVDTAKVHVYEKIIDFHKGQIQLSGSFAVQVGPNPAPKGSSVNIRTALSDYDKMEVAIYDHVGNLMTSGEGEPSIFWSTYIWDLSNHPEISGTFVAYMTYYKDGVIIGREKQMIGIEK